MIEGSYNNESIENLKAMLHVVGARSLHLISYRVGIAVMLRCAYMCSSSCHVNLPCGKHRNQNSI